MRTLCKISLSAIRSTSTENIIGCGHLFQGRYKALLIDADSYLLALIRYIHLNPVRAGIVSRPEDYPWTSHCDYLNEAHTPWLTVEWALAQFGNEFSKASDAFKAFVDQGCEEGYRREFYQGSFEGRALGDDNFIRDVLLQVEEQEQSLFSIDELIEGVCAVYHLTEVELVRPGKAQPAAEARAVAALMVRNSSKLSLTTLGRRFNRDLSGLSQAARRLERQIDVGGESAAKYRQVIEGITECQA